MSTVNLGCKLDLKKIALHARNAEYNPKVISRPFAVHTDVLDATKIYERFVLHLRAHSDLLR